MVGLLLIAFQSVPAYEALTLRADHDDDRAYDADPNKLPVKEPVYEPVLYCADALTTVGLLLIAFQSVPAYDADTERAAHDDDKA